MKPTLPPDALVLAPMATLTHRGFRELVAGFGGCDLYFTEMVNAKSVLHDKRWEGYYLDTGPEPGKTVIQILGSDADSIAAAVSAILDMMPETVARPFGFDLNMGCSAPEIMRRNGGAAWLKRPAEAAALVARVKPLVGELSLSVKLRIGEEDDPEALLSLARALASEGADFLTLHPRIRKEKYSRPPRWGRVHLLAKELSIPILGNGDIDSPENWAERRREAKEAGAKLSGMMIGRAAARQPWIFSLIRGIESDPSFTLEVDLEDCARRFLSLLALRQPPEFQRTRAIRFFYYFSQNLDYGNRIMKRTQEAKSPEEALAMFVEYFKDAPGERVKRYSAK